MSITLFILRRLGLGIITLFILSLIVFFAAQVLPGDPARAIDHLVDARAVPRAEIAGGELPLLTGRNSRDMGRGNAVTDNFAALAKPPAGISVPTWAPSGTSTIRSLPPQWGSR